MKKAVLAALLAAGFAAANANAAIIDFNFSGNQGLRSQLTFNAGGLDLTATGGLRNGSVYDESAAGLWPYPKIGQYTQGLGVTSTPIDRHTADNLVGGEYVKFVFGQAVQVLNVTVAYQYQPASLCFFGTCVFPATGDADASYLAGADPSGIWSHLSVDPNHRKGGWYEYTYSLTDLAFDNVFRFGARQGQDNDSFKILGMQVSVADPAGTVPAPATLALLGVGMLALGARRRTPHAAN